MELRAKAVRTVTLAIAGSMLVISAAGAARADRGQKGADGLKQQGMAQREMTPEMKAKRMERLTKQLGLSVDQQTAIGKIFDDRDARIKAVMDDTTMDRKAKRQAIQDARTKAEEELNKVLTADQQKKYREMQEKRQQRAKEQMKD